MMGVNIRKSSELGYFGKNLQLTSTCQGWPIDLINLNSLYFYICLARVSSHYWFFLASYLMLPGSQGGEELMMSGGGRAPGV